jgi:hypothetical protein
VPQFLMNSDDDPNADTIDADDPLLKPDTAKPLPTDSLTAGTGNAAGSEPVTGGVHATVPEAGEAAHGSGAAGAPSPNTTAVAP